MTNEHIMRAHCAHRRAARPIKKAEVAIALMLFIVVTAFPASAGAAPESKRTDEEQESILRERSKAEDDGEQGVLFRLSGIGMFLASAGDAATTEWGLAHSGIREGNPLAANRSLRLSVHVIAPAVVWWSSDRLQKAGHGKLAFVVRIGVTLAYSYAVMHNIRTLHARQ